MRRVARREIYHSVCGVRGCCLGLDRDSKGILTEYEAGYAWWENVGNVHADGESPYALFVITSPKAHAGRKIGILFKWTSADLPPPPVATDIGKAFSFAIPNDLFPKFDKIENRTVECFREIPFVKTDEHKPQDK